MPVPVLVIVTLAAGTTAPEESSTSPCIDWADCARQPVTAAAASEEIKRSRFISTSIRSYVLKNEPSNTGQEKRVQVAGTLRNRYKRADCEHQKPELGGRKCRSISQFPFEGLIQSPKNDLVLL